MKTAFKYLLFTLIILSLIYVSGPKVKYEKVDHTPITLDIPISKLDEYVAARENAVPGIKPDNHARIIWADSIQKTDNVFVYLHGFAASYGEADPLIYNLSEKYQANAYLSRLSEHGTSHPDEMKDLTPKKWVNSALEAIAIGKRLGEKLIIVCTSTGCTLASYLAAGDPEIDALIMMSPNIDIYDKNSRLITKPWGKYLLKLIQGGEYHIWDNKLPCVQKYWTTKKHINGLIALRSLIDQTMHQEVFREIYQPYQILYYYRDENHFDDVIDIASIKHFNISTSTPSGEKEVLAIDNASGHVIGSKCLNENYLTVQNAIMQFLETTLMLRSMGSDQGLSD